MFTNSYGAVATNVAILHPNIFYYVIDASWSSSNSPEFWNYGNTDTSNNNNPVKKTIYSPSPTYFTEPKTAAFTGFILSGGNSSGGYNISGSFNKGWNFYCQPNATGGTAFFSALGYREYSGSVGGAVTLVNVSGYYWSAGPSGTPTYARSLGFRLGYVNPRGENDFADGFTVRSISE